ncbi:hypothetical protein C8R45DRAFT_1080912, partial [Mycena sanguinolenta]
MQVVRALRFLPARVAFRPQIPAYITHRLLATASQSTTPSQAVQKHPCANFYRTKINIDPLSCDWEKFPFPELFTVDQGWHDLTEMEFFVRRVAKIRGQIRPLAFLSACDPCVVFEVAGKYYYLNTGEAYLEQYGGGFASHDEFLEDVTRDRIDGAKFCFPDDTDALYYKVWRVQDRRKSAAEKARNS